MAAVNLKSMSEEKIADFLNSFDTVLTDCDDVLWRQMTPLPNSAEVLNLFRELGKRVFYITNNGTKTRAEFVEKCRLLNFTASEEEMLCTSYLSACYLKDQGFTKKVYVIGSEGITKELDRLGIPHCGSGADVLRSDVSCRLFEKDPDVGAVIVGFDEHFSYPKLLKAATYLNDKNVHFVGTNTDKRSTAGKNIIVPGSGSLIQCVEACAQRKAVIVGKPETYISQAIMKRYKVDPKRTLMIGDQPYTDILLGTRCGFKTLLVLTGGISVDDVKKWKQSESKEDKDLIPDFYTDKLGDLLPHLQKFKCGGNH